MTVTAKGSKLQGLGTKGIASDLSAGLTKSIDSVTGGMANAVVGGVVGLIMVRRYHDWAMLIFSGLVGGLLVTRGLSAWFQFLQNGVLDTVLVIVQAGGSIVLQGGFLNKGKVAPTGTPPATPPTTPPATK